MFLGLLGRRAELKAAIAADARRLIESFHEHAYFEARERVVAAASIAGARRAMDAVSLRSLGAKALRSASLVPTCGDKITVRGRAGAILRARAGG